MKIMGKPKTIDQWSLGYALIKYLWAKHVFNLYYRKIQVRNSEIVPRNKPVILAANHQNALMDALAIVIRLPFQTVFMTRADIFQKPFIRKVLMYLKMLPIYRIRDGVSSLAKNEEIFDETTNILKNHFNPLFLFPEGNHGNKRRLRQLVKGLFRIAFKAQEDYKENSGVIIIPIGIDYSHYQKFRQTLFINLGQPIEVADYWKQYEKNQATGINSLRERLEEEMRKLMIDIQSEEYYNTYMGLRRLYRPFMYKRLGIKTDTLASRFDTDKVLISMLDRELEDNPENIKTIDKKFTKYASLRDKLKLRDWVFTKEKYSVTLNILSLIFCLILSPLFLFGLVNNLAHYFIPVKVAKGIKDTQFRSTASWGSGAVIQIFYYLLLTVLAIIFIPYWWLVILYVISLPFSGIVALGIRNMFIKTIARLRYTLYRKKLPELKNAITLRAEIIDLLNTIQI